MTRIVYAVLFTVGILLSFLNNHFPMAWGCSGRSNAQLVANLQAAGIFKSPTIKEAMLAVDRGDFVQWSPYNDSPQTIGYGATISAPHMHAHCLEVLANHLKPGAKALDIGSGTGILAAYMSAMVGPTGTVFGVEHIPELAYSSIDNIRKHHSDRLDKGIIQILAKDGRHGLPEYAPFDCIHIGAAAAHTPTELLQQLKIGGRLVAPIGTYDQHLVMIDRTGEDTFQETKLMGVRYVPLTSKETQLADA